MRRSREVTDFDRRVAEIHRGRSALVKAVPFTGRYGDWEDLQGRHRGILSVIEPAHRRLSALQAPHEIEGVWRASTSTTAADNW